ncbi:LamB/YcsF family protein [Xylanimonas cellulosilytica DSM 15894]|uniref:5-oxoprolinase subunit A n=1 Tax=Xylanimonas cellulosilytica (strain DSM 15894 / JCM 12276 / CECT 5975 / KCTC 9989 / LMG 20990 / NBRC 107835 / XIL07) TaxID=446471 RepID=D1BTW0_XYLCX|nr:LamB/YcsF family protein [Xylanimonas cellulosilytica DSM 15894]
MGAVDLNADLGEGFGQWTLGDDAAMLDVVSSANVAGGFHAGDPAGIRRTVRLAAERGVVVGAHVGYRDLAGFGRREMDVPSAELQADIVYQLGALQGLAAAEGTRVAYVKPHGALYNSAQVDERIAHDVAAAVAAVDPTLVLLGLPGSAALAAAGALGLPTAAEAFADRAYTPAGTLVSRREPGAVLHDPELVAARMVRLVTDGVVEAVDGSLVPVRVDSICVHGDSPGAVGLARRLREALTAEGIAIGPFATLLGTAAGAAVGAGAAGPADAAGGSTTRARFVGPGPRTEPMPTNRPAGTREG